MVMVFGQKAGRSLNVIPHAPLAPFLFTLFLPPSLVGVSTLNSKLDSLLLRARTEDLHMSKASMSQANATILALGLERGGCIKLPNLAAYMPSPPLVGFAWRQGQQERLASPRLLQMLDEWVKTGALPPVDNALLDVQSFESVEFEAEGVSHWTGKPDAIFARSGLGRRSELNPMAVSAAVAIDWKTPSAFADENKIEAIGLVQSIGFGSFRGFLYGAPVFITDLSKGFRGWWLLDHTIYTLHPTERDLTLEEGVALIRFFLAHDRGRELVVEKDRTITVPRPPSAAHPTSGSTAGSAGGTGGGASRGDGGGSGGSLGAAGGRGRGAPSGRKVAGNDGGLSSGASSTSGPVSDLDYQTVVAEAMELVAPSYRYLLGI